MSITVRCPSCGQSIKAADKYAGLRVKCPGCESIVAVPMPPQTAVSDDAPPKPESPTDDTMQSVSPAMFRNRPFLFIMCCLLVLAYGAGLAILLIWWIRCKTTRFILTEKRAILREGILSKHTKDVRHKDIRLVEVHQSLAQRLFGVGNLAISSAGHGGVEIEINGIQQPQKIKDRIDSLRD